MPQNSTRKNLYKRQKIPTIEQITKYLMKGFLSFMFEI